MNEVLRKDLAEAREVCPTTSLRLLNEGALLVDVREPDEVAALGFAGCDLLTIPLSQFEDRWSEVPRDRDVILACAGGVRSLKATYFLMYQGYDRVSNMSNGMARWAAKGFAITGSARAGVSTDAAGSCCGGTAEPGAAASCCGGSAELAAGASGAASCDCGSAGASAQGTSC